MDRAVPHRFAGLDADAHALPVDLARRVATPALVVRLDAVRRNVGRVLARAGGDPARWRPHVKTLKVPEVLEALVGAGLRGFKCATTREASVLADALRARDVIGGDVLVAYPLVGPALRRLGTLAREHRQTRFSVLCEDPRAVVEIPAEVDVFADVDPGMHRTGVALDDVERVAGIAGAAARRFRGLHAYEGHLVQPDRDARRTAAVAVYGRLVELLERLRAAGVRAGELVTSGTPAFLEALAYEPFARLRDTVHRVSPGTVVYHDARTEEQVPELGLEPAALVATRVVSRPAPGIATCDAGSKSIAVDAGDPCAIPIGHPELLAGTPSEEHLPLRVLRGTGPQRGAELMLAPRHVCPTVNLADEAILIDGDDARVVPVRARAHDLRVD